MTNQPPWVKEVDADFELGETAHKQGNAAYKRAAERIVAEMEAARARGERLTQTAVAEHLGRHPSRISRLLTWLRDGCPEGGPFAAEAAARRKLRRRTNAQPWLLDPDTGKVVVDGSREPQAAAVLKAQYFCERQANALAQVDRKTMEGAFEGSTRQVDTLEALAARLREVASTSQRALAEVEDVLGSIRRPPPEAEDDAPHDVPKDAPF